MGFNIYGTTVSGIKCKSSKLALNIITPFDWSYQHILNMNPIYNGIVGYNIHPTYGIYFGSSTWNDTSCSVRFAIPSFASEFKIVLTGFYQNGGCGHVTISDKTGNLLTFQDAWINDPSGQSLTINGSDIFTMSTQNIIMQEYTVKINPSIDNFLNIQMNYVDGYPFNPRYIYSLIVK